MMATSKKILEQEPSEVEMLLPWHAAGTLNARDARRVDEALARDPGLAKQYAAIQEEYAETIHLNESLGAPSARAMQKLFAAIDGEPARKPSVSFDISARIAGFFAKLSPRTLVWSASLGADHPHIGIGTAAARAGAVRAGCTRRRHHGAARQLSSLDHRRRQGRPVSAAIRQQSDGQGRICRPDAQAAKREDRQSRGRCTISRATAHRRYRINPRPHGPRSCQLAE